MSIPRIGRPGSPADPVVLDPSTEALPDSVTPETHPEVFVEVGRDLMLDDDIAMSHVPSPPRCILARLARETKVWRWMSEPQMNRMGKRNYEMVSPTSSERTAISTGRDCPAGVHLGADNTIRWLDDGVLGACPRALFEARAKAKRARVITQTKTAGATDQLQEQMERMARESGSRMKVKASQFLEEESLKG